MDQMLQRQKVPWWLIIGAAGLGIVLCLLAALPTQLDWWAGLLQSIAKSRTTLGPIPRFSDPRFILDTSTNASLGLIRGGVTLFAAASLLELAKSRRNLACAAMLLLALFELISFAGSSLLSFKPGPPYSHGVLDLLARHPGDYRILHRNPNAAMTTGALDIAGDDPTGLLRYNRFLDFAQGLDPDTTSVGASARSYNTNALRMVRLRYRFSNDDQSGWEYEDPLPQLSLVDHFRVMTNYHEILSTLTNANFDMRDTVILESRPDPAPQPATEKGAVHLLASSTDSLEIEADVAAPCLLLITDAYSGGWRALARPGSAQARYQILPANYCLRAISLQAGRHLLRVEYSPLGFRIGRVVSLVSLALFFLLAGLTVKNHFRRLTAAPLAR
jgi:hypothetical protein